MAAVLSGIVSIWQARISRDSTDAARASAKAAESMAGIANEALNDMKKGGTDTRDLALAAKAQSDSTKRQAGIMGQQMGA